MHSIKEEDLKRIDLFSDLSDFELANIINKSFLRCYSKGATLFSPDDECISLGIILKGSISFNRITTTGDEIKLKEMGSGDLFGELICLSRENYPNWLISKKDCEVLYIPRVVIKKLLNLDSFVTKFFKRVSKKSLGLVNKIEMLSYNRIDQRVAHYLLINRDMPSVTTLSKRICASREATSRALNRLKSIIDISSIKELESVLYS